MVHLAICTKNEASTSCRDAQQNSHYLYLFCSQYDRREFQSQRDWYYSTLSARSWGIPRPQSSPSWQISRPDAGHNFQQKDVGPKGRKAPEDPGALNSYAILSPLPISITASAWSWSLRGFPGDRNRCLTPRLYLIRWRRPIRHCAHLHS